MVANYNDPVTGSLIPKRRDILQIDGMGYLEVSSSGILEHPTGSFDTRGGGGTRYFPGWGGAARPLIP